jgi:hypothetical protein
MVGGSGGARVGGCRAAAAGWVGRVGFRARGWWDFPGIGYSGCMRVGTVGLNR